MATRRAGDSDTPPRRSSTNSSSAQSDKRKLVLRIQAELPHGTNAFREFVEHFTPQIYRRALRLVGSPSDAEEVVQDVFLRVFRSIGRYRFEKPIGHWLQTITSNAARNLLRTSFRDQRRKSSLASSVDLRMPASQSDPIFVEALEDAMKLLDPETRIAIRLRYVEEFSFPEIAEQLGMGESKAKMRVRRGVDKLRSLLGTNDDD